jgi:hypothetical protein
MLSSCPPNGISPKTKELNCMLNVHRLLTQKAITLDHSKSTSKLLKLLML